MSDESTPITRLPIVVLISGNGSNLQAIMDAADHGDLPDDLRGGAGLADAV